MLLAVALAVVVLFATVTVTVNAAEFEALRGETVLLDVGSALFTLLLGLAAVSLLLLRPRLPVKGRERDR